MKPYTAFLLAACLLAACNSPENKALTKQSSSGKTCEVLVAIDKAHYQGATKQLLDSIFLSPQEGLPNPEPSFSVVSVPLSSLRTTRMFMMHRNIVVCDIAPSNSGKCYLRHNQWAEPQVVIELAATDEASLHSLLRTHAPRMVEELHATEYERMRRAFDKDRNAALMERVQQKYGFSLTLPSEFQWATANGDFLWLRKETKDFSLGVLVYTSPYRDRQQLDADRILNRLDTLMRRNVPGPAEGSYMGTERRVDIAHRTVTFAPSAYAVEARGLWRLFGDFMGGPFVAYSLLSPDGATVVDLVGFVYCPRFDKRDYLMQVDGICRSITWPTE